MTQIIQTNNYLQRRLEFTLDKEKNGVPYIQSFESNTDAMGGEVKYSDYIMTNQDHIFEQATIEVPDEEKKVFVGGLPHDCKHEDVKVKDV